MPLRNFGLPVFHRDARPNAGVTWPTACGQPRSRPNPAGGGDGVAGEVRPAAPLPVKRECEMLAMAAHSRPLALGSAEQEREVAHDTTSSSARRGRAVRVSL